MSSVIPVCDSDEEVFWGPVTAKEIEILWRYRMANKQSERSEQDSEQMEEITHDLNKLSSESGFSLGRTGTLQEVPCVEDLKNLSDREKVLLEENVSIGNESTLPLHETNFIIKADAKKIPMDVEDESTLDVIEDNSTKDIVNDSKELEEQASFLTDFSTAEKKFSFGISSIENCALNRNSLISEVEEIPNPKIEMAETYEKLNQSFNDTENITMIDTKYKYSTVGDKINSILHESQQQIITKTDSNNLEEISDENIINDHSKYKTMCNETNELNLLPQRINEIHSAITNNESHHGIRNNEINSEDPVCYRLDNIENIPPDQQIVNQSDKEMKCELNPTYNPTVVETSRSEVINNDQHENILQEVPTEIIEDQEDIISSEFSVNKIKDELTNAEGESESSDEKSFFSLNSEEDKFSSTSQNTCVPSNQYCLDSLNDLQTLKNKENEDPCQSSKDNIKSRIPVTSVTKLPVLKPAKFQYGQCMSDVKWLNDLKRKKIPKQKKPEYMVSPAKLGNVLKNHKPTSRTNKTPGNTENCSKSKSNPLISKTKFEIPASKLITPKKKQFEYVKSPISEYIRSGTGITAAKSLPLWRTPNKPGTSSSVPNSEEKKGKAFILPKVFKHQGRIAGDKKIEEISVVTPRAVRTTNLQETSFAGLPYALKQQDVSVLEEQF